MNMILEEKLKDQKMKIEVSDFKPKLKVLLNTIDELQDIISDKWLSQYKKEGLLNFEFVLIKRKNHLIGEYKTTILKITLINNRVIVLNPVFSFTNLDFRFEFYLVDDPVVKNIIIRKRNNENEYKWVYYKSISPKKQYPFTHMELEGIITNWLYKIN